MTSLLHTVIQVSGIFPHIQIILTFLPNSLTPEVSLSKNRGKLGVYIMERHFLLKSAFGLREFSGDLEAGVQGTDFLLSGSLEMISLGQIQRTVHAQSFNEKRETGCVIM